MEKMSLPRMSPVDQTRWSPRARRWYERQKIDQVVVFHVPMTVRFRSVTEREGVLLHGPSGWGECAPFSEYGAGESAAWLQSAARGAARPAPAALRGSVPVNVTIPVCDPAAAAARVREAGCATAKVKVADPRSPLESDVVRVRAVAEALAADFGPGARLRIDVNGAWERDEACRALEKLTAAAAAVGGLEYVEQPCASVEDLAYVRRHSGVLVAADESIRRAADPFLVVERGAADLAVLKVAPLGGVEAALRLAESLPIPVVVSSAIDTSIGLSAGVELAAALPSLPYACGLDTRRLLGSDVTATGMESVGGELSPSLARSIRQGELVGDCPPVAEQTLARWTARVEDMIAYLSEAK